MSDATRERQRILAILEELKAQAIRDCRRFPGNVADSALAVINTYQECIDKIMEASDD